MRKKHNRLQCILLILFVLPAFVWAGWYKVHENPGSVSFNQGFSAYYDLSVIYVAATDGWVYSSPNQGEDWTSTQVSPGNDLFSVGVGATSDSNFVFACGARGTLARYNVEDDFWRTFSGITTKDLLALQYNYARQEMWVVGDSNFVALSKDALHWIPQPIQAPLMKIKYFYPTYDRTILLGDDNQNIYIHYLNTLPDSSVTNDTTLTLENYRIVAVVNLSGESSDQAVFLAQDLGTDEIHLMQFNIYNYPTEIEDLDVIPFANVNSIGQYFDYNTYNTTYWVGTSDGAIWESQKADYGGSLSDWRMVYHDAGGSAIHSFISASEQGLRGMAFGDNELVLLNSFKIKKTEPAPNRVVNYPLNSVRIQFSAIPDVFQLERNTFVFSNYSGLLNFNVSYDANDSTTAIYQLKRQAPQSAIPGEIWHFAFSPGLVALGDTVDQLQLTPRHFGYTFAQIHNFSFAFEKDTTVLQTKRVSTNWVAGFFNNDDLLDLATFSDNTLYCFYRQKDLQGNVTQASVAIPFPQISLQISKPIYHQLLTANLNNDNLPDLILYDANTIYFLINQSNGSTINFRLSSNSYHDQSIRQVIAYNDNNNAQTDLLVLGNQLTIVYDVYADNNTFNTSVIYYSANNIEKVAVGNVDDDLANDLVMISNGNVLYRSGSAQYGLNYGGSADTLTRNGLFYNLKLANLDNDNKLEIIAMDSQGLTVIPPYFGMIHRKTSQGGYLIHFNSNMEAPSDFIVQDFGGDPTTDLLNPLDIAILQEDSLLIYQNQTANEGAFAFSSQPIFKMSLGSPDFPSDRLSACDFDAWGTLDILASDFETGTVQILRKPRWKPTLQLVERNKNQIRLQWDPSPADMGTLDHYILYKSVDDDSVKLQFNTTATNFTDNHVMPYHDYHYSVQAVYREQTFSPPSDPISIKTYFELNGEQHGVLADTTLPYWAKSNLLVPAGDSLRIMPGIQIEFNRGTGLEIAGRCIVAGNDTSAMIDFSDRDSIWNGITLLNATDTVRFMWFSIDNAETGIHALGRPFKLQYGGFQNNTTGIRAEQCSFSLENILTDSCSQGIDIESGSTAFLKNITVLNSKDHSIFATGNATQVTIKNAIIWNNRKPVFAEAPATIQLRYSTVDSIGPHVITEHLSPLPPRFVPSPNSNPSMIDPMSPTIDAGDPADSFDQEPQPNGGRINQGVFGNTPLATPSLQPRIKAYTLRSHLEGYPGQKDSTSVIIKNWGHAALSIQNMQLLHSNDNGPFFLAQGGANDEIAAQDSLLLKLFFQPPQRGTFSDSLLIVCNDPHLVKGNLAVALSGRGLNSRPHLLNTPPAIAFVDSPYVFTPLIEDADHDSVVVTPLIKPDWLIWEKGTLHGTPTASDTGAHPVSLKLDDLFGGIDTLNFVITVISTAQPRIIAPVLKIFQIGKLLNAQAAARFHIAVFDSLKSGLKEATASYRMRLFLRNQDTADTLRIDTTAVPEFTFTKLRDGKYNVTFFVFKKSAGRLLHQQETQFFTINASRKVTGRFRWIMASLPRDTVFDLATLHLKDSSAVLFRWNAQTEKYDLLNNAPIFPGEAFWIMPLKALHIDLNPFPIGPTHEAVQTGTTPSIKLEAGWNQIGLPLPYYERWIDCHPGTAQGEEISWETAFRDSLISPVVYWFEQSQDFIGYHVEPIDSNTIAIPWRGYWMFARKNLTLYFSDEPYFPSEKKNPLSKPLALRQSRLRQETFLMNLTLACDNYRDDYNVFGFSAAGNATLPEPPYFKDFVGIAFETANQSLCQSVKLTPESDEAVISWPVTLRTTFPDKRHHLEWQQLASGHEPFFLYLVDQETEKIINMNEQTTYDFTPKKSDYALMIYASKDAHFKPAIIPLDYKVEQNYPNPFNPRTTIRVGIPQSAANEHVSLKIYDVLGKEIKTLADGTLQPGFHKFEWDGTNSAGNSVSSGIYFYRLQAGHKAFMRKMILLR